MKCKRCGLCCSTTALSISPKELKSNYEAWKKGDNRIVHYADIDLVYPMLTFIKYDKKIKRYRYRCKHLAFNGKKAVCTIHDNKPKVCQDYGMKAKLSMGNHVSKNQVFYPGCAF